MTQPETPSRWGRYGGRPLLVLCLVGLVDAVDRGVLPGVLPKIQRALHVSDSTAGLLYTAVIVATLLLAVPGGLLSDRKDRRTIMAGVLAIWSVTTALAASVQSFWQLLVLRSGLGIGDAVNDPAAQSLVADYYAQDVRGRAYAFQRVVPTVGMGLGLGVGAALGAAFGWRIAVLAVAVPGISVALLVRKLPLPERGDSDGARPVAAVTRPAWDDVRATLSVRSVRVLLVSTAIVNGVLASLGFWGVTYHVRASGMSEGTAGAVAGGLIALGAVGGGILGGQVTDRFRSRVRGWPMLLSGAVTGLGTVLLFVSFLDGIPVGLVRLPLQTLGVAFVVASLPPLTVIAAEVVPASLRGTSFGLLKLGANCLGAVLPPVIGAIADTHRFLDSHHERVGDLGFAFRVITPTVLIGSWLLLRGRRHFDDDVARATEAA